MRVELLFFDGCPSHEVFLPRARALLEQEGIDTEIELLQIDSAEQAESERFLGSPSVRIDGRDVEPDAEDRADFGLKCRLYDTESGLVGVPPDEFVVAALQRERTKASDERRLSGQSSLEASLRSIGIAPEPLAASRAAPLAATDRRLYRAILARLANGEPATRAWLSTNAAEEELQEQLARLAKADLIGLDGDGEIATAYPLSVHPSRQRVDLVDGRRLWACCAIDALGIPAMVGADGTVFARDPDLNTEIEVRVGATGDASAEPEDAVVLAGRAGNGTTACCACPFINFFPSSASADAFASVHPNLKAVQLTVEEATAAGRLLFGQAFEYLDAAYGDLNEAVMPPVT